MNQRFKTIQTIYLYALALVYAVLGYVLYGFYQRRLGTDGNPYNPSVIERIKIPYYQGALVACVVAIIVIALLIRGINKHKKLARYGFVVTFLLQIGIVIFAGMFLKEVEGVYFSKSPFVQKYFYFAGIIGGISLMVLVGWVMKLMQKKPPLEGAAQEE